MPLCNRVLGAMNVCSEKLERQMGRRDGPVVKNACSSSRGPIRVWLPVHPSDGLQLPAAPPPGKSNAFGSLQTPTLLCTNPCVDAQTHLIKNNRIKLLKSRAPKHLGFYLCAFLEFVNIWRQKEWLPEMRAGAGTQSWHLMGAEFGRMKCSNGWW